MKEETFDILAVMASIAFLVVVAMYLALSLAKAIEYPAATSDALPEQIQSVQPKMGQ